MTNAVDLDRYTFRADVATPPRRAAIFSNNAREGGTFVNLVREACRQVGIELDEFGSGLGRTMTNPEKQLAHYDLVFAKARCAIEAMAAGCTVIAVDAAGYGGRVTSANIDQMLDWNVGDRCLQRPHSAAAIADDIRQIECQDAVLVTKRVRERCDLSAAAMTYVGLYRAALDARITEIGPPATWPDSHAEVLIFAAELEARLRGGEGVWSMPPLPPSVGAGLATQVVSARRFTSRAERYEIVVEVHNRGPEQLATIGPTPVHLSYHWLEPQTGVAVVHDGERTPLTRPVGPGQVHRQSVMIVAPLEPGLYRLRVTMVQESVRWFTDLPHPVFADVSVTVGDPLSEWTLADITTLSGKHALGESVVVETLGFVSAPLDGMLTFATTSRLLTEAVGVGCSAVVVSPELASDVPENMGFLISDDPAATFWELHEQLARRTDFYGRDQPNFIDPSARVDPTASIATCNVRIGADTVIGAGCVIEGRCDVGSKVTVGPGAVIGAAGFQTSRINGRHVEFTHTGKVVIGDGVAILANATMPRTVSSIHGARCVVACRKQCVRLAQFAGR